MDHDRPVYRKSIGDSERVHTKLVLVIPALVGILLTSVLACNNADPEAVLAQAQVELDKHRTLWEQTGSPDYTYEYKAICFHCSRQTVKITVTNGDIGSVVYAESGFYGESGEPPVRWDGGPSYPTIDSLFDDIQHAITNEVEQVTVSYNSEFGYPTNVAIDSNVNATDTGYTHIANAYSPR